VTDNREDLVETFRGLSDEYLLERVRSGDLTDAAQDLAEQELVKRGIVPPARQPRPAESDTQEPAEPVVFATIARFLIPIDAHILKGRLEAEGIPVLLADSNLVQTHNLIAVAVGGIRVQVPASRVSEAREILAAIRSGDFAVGEDFDPGSDSR